MTIQSATGTFFIYRKAEKYRKKKDENRCTVCQGGKDGDKFQKDGLGIYVGESSRSMYERSKEHEKDRIDEEPSNEALGSGPPRVGCSSKV